MTTEIPTTEERRILALAKHLDVDIDELTSCSYNENIIEHGSEEYLVVTDDEADDLWEEALDSYLEECVYPELPEMAKQYFNDDAWKNDARHDGRAHSLNGYDGGEEEAKAVWVDQIWKGEKSYDSESFFIYRQN